MLAHVQVRGCAQFYGRRQLVLQDSQGFGSSLGVRQAPEVMITIRADIRADILNNLILCLQDEASSFKEPLMHSTRWAIVLATIDKGIRFSQC